MGPLCWCGRRRKQRRVPEDSGPTPTSMLLATTWFWTTGGLLPCGGTRYQAFEITKCRGSGLICLTRVTSFLRTGSSKTFVDNPWPLLEKTKSVCCLSGLIHA